MKETRVTDEAWNEENETRDNGLDEKLKDKVLEVTKKEVNKGNEVKAKEKGIKSKKMAKGR